MISPSSLCSPTSFFHKSRSEKSFRNQRYQSETMLSSYVWETKLAIDQIPSLKWSTITVLPAYSNITKPCQLCLYQKYAIIRYPDPENLCQNAPTNESFY